LDCSLDVIRLRLIFVLTVGLQTMTKRLVERVEEDMKSEIVVWAAFYEHRLRQGSKAIFHLEAFCAKIMSIYKRKFDVPLSGCTGGTGLELGG